MINPSPVEAWDTATVIFTFAGSGGVHLWFWVMCILCIVPLFVSLKAENAVEKEHNGNN